MAAWWPSGVSTFLEWLQRKMTIAVWPDEQDNTLNVPDGEDNGLPCFPASLLPCVPAPPCTSVCCLLASALLLTDLLLMGSKRAAEPIACVPATALDATIGAVAPRPVRTECGEDGPRFLGSYSEADLRELCRTFRFAGGRHAGMTIDEMFAQLGFAHLLFCIDVSDSFVHRLSLYDTEQRPENLVTQFVAVAAFVDLAAAVCCCQR